MDNLTLAYLLIAIGVVLLVAELFIPSGGLLTVASIVVLLIGVYMVFSYGDRTLAVVTLAAVMVGLPILSILMMKVWPYTPMGRRLVLKYPDDDTSASMPEHKQLEELRGRIGRTTSSMRPSGTVDFDGRRIDAVSEGMMIEPGRQVKCIDVRAGRVIVRLLEQSPELDGLDDLDLRT